MSAKIRVISAKDTRMSRMRCDPKCWPVVLLLIAGTACWPRPVCAAPSIPPADDPAKPAPDLPSANDLASATGTPTPLKTLTFLSLASINDFGFGYAFGSLAAGGAMVAANLTTGWGLYYLHEQAWIASDPEGKLREDTTAVRTATFTVANSARIFGLGMLLTGSPVISGGFVVFNAVGDAAAYAITDRLWTNLPANPTDSEGARARERVD